MKKRIGKYIYTSIIPVFYIYLSRTATFSLILIIIISKQFTVYYCLKKGEKNKNEEDAQGKGRMSSLYERKKLKSDPTNIQQIITIKNEHETHLPFST